LDGPVLLFDGVCTLCNAAVDFVLRHDRVGAVRFASLQSEVGVQILAEAGLPRGFTDSLVLWERVGAGRPRVLLKSEAAIRLAELMGGPWRAASCLRAVPLPLRDRVYDYVAANRYRWFGQREMCRMPTPEERGRLLG
jgi:predicted DCC family thiol-disulfide oxidoreductase YuxK